MFTITADDRNGVSTSAGCTTCCCHLITVSAGSAEALVIDYTAWAASMAPRGLGLPSVHVETIARSGAVSGRPTNVDVRAATTVGVAVSGDVAAGANDTDGDALTFAHLPLHGPKFGTLTMQANGTWSYTPRAGYVGYDEFLFSTTDGKTAAVVNKAMIKVSQDTTNVLPDAPDLGLFHVDATDPLVNGALRTSMRVAVSPAVDTGDRFRLHVKQPAYDCDGREFIHILCIDATVGAC